MYSRTYVHTAHLELEPITPQQWLDSAVHWERLADEQDAIADRETAQGLPRGDVSSYRARAQAWRQVAAECKARGGM